jgi:hypothetical protein
MSWFRYAVKFGMFTMAAPLAIGENNMFKGTKRK